MRKNTTGRRAGLQQEVGKRRPFDTAEEEVYLNLLRTADRLAAGPYKLFRSHGLSPSLYNALRIVVGHGDAGVRVHTIADQMIVREPDISRLVDRLVKLGFVDRRRCEEDRRVVWVTPTAAGRKKISDLAKPIRALHVQQLKHLGRERLGQLNDLLVAAREGAVDAGGDTEAGT
jgi:DNA-binding MarR family transcriptional regulator